MKAKKQRATFYHRFDGGIMGQCAFELEGGKPVAGICRIWGQAEKIHPIEWHLWGQHISKILKTKPDILATIMVGHELSEESR